MSEVPILKIIKYKVDVIGRLCPFLKLEPVPNYDSSHQTGIRIDARLSLYLAFLIESAVGFVLLT